MSFLAAIPIVNTILGHYVGSKDSEIAKKVADAQKAAAQANLQAAQITAQSGTSVFSQPLVIGGILLAGFVLIVVVMKR